MNDPTAGLPLPRLSRGRFTFALGKTLTAWSDESLFDATGVRIAFTERDGGVSTGFYSSLNLGSNVSDDPLAIEENRRRVCVAMGADPEKCVTAHQVHGTRIVEVAHADPSALSRVRSEAQNGADGIVVSCGGTSALLCYADCMPIILVSPAGKFAVLHSGWRGTMGHICIKGAHDLSEVSRCTPDQLNVYIGPYIHSECFEVSEELAQRFSNEFGIDATPAFRHVDLGVCVRHDLASFGVRPDRIADVDRCTSCYTDEFYSYRAQKGKCGRHGAFACKIADKSSKGNVSYGNF